MISKLIGPGPRQSSGLRRRIALLTLAVSAGVTMTPELGAARSCEQGVQLYERLSPSIVRIEARQAANIFARPQLGSAVAVSDRLLVTADHVVAGANEIWVLDAEGDKQRGEIVQRHPEADLALIRLPATGAPPALPLSDDLPARAGQCVAALGNVMHGGVGIFCGMVSMIGPPLPGGAGQILTDIVAPPGLSGGALVDCATGSLVGIVSFGLVDLSSPRETGGIIGAAPVALLSDLLKRTTVADSSADARRSLRQREVDLHP
jgi:S1-C subfamily serine protease